MILDNDTIDKRHRRRFKEGQRLIVDNEESSLYQSKCTFVEFDPDIYGVIWIRVDGKGKDTTIAIESVDYLKED